MTFLDHAFRHGDSLVGLTVEQIQAFHWKGARSASRLASKRPGFANRSQKALRLRREIQGAGEETPDWELRDRLDEADSELARVKTQRRPGAGRVLRGQEAEGARGAAPAVRPSPGLAPGDANAPGPTPTPAGSRNSQRESPAGAVPLGDRVPGGAPAGRAGEPWLRRDRRQPAVRRKEPHGIRGPQLLEGWSSSFPIARAEAPIWSPTSSAAPSVSSANAASSA